MCGIICIYASKKRELEKQFFSKCSQYADTLKPRGPDGGKYYIDTQQNLFMGFKRLAIMDLSENGMQPFAELNLNLICNGEIYNYKELIKKYNIHVNSHSDCQVILPLVRRFGFTEAIKMLDGEFALCVYDCELNKIYVARDRYGVRPLYFGYNEQKCMYGFASEMKGAYIIHLMN
jgi:asparagine synthase (glutamine-hydrolysing)